jgi:putative glutamine transport system substrate-binding protein
MEAGKLRGIEVDILEEYVSWLKQKKNVSLIVTYKPYSEFGAFYNSVKAGSTKVVGLGSVTSSGEREKEVAFSPPYLQNMAVLITAGRVPTLREKTPQEVAKVFGTLNAVAVNQSSHMTYLNDLKKNYLPSLKLSIVESQHKVLESILSDNNKFGYVDIVAYWSFLKTNPKFLKIQKAFTAPKEHLAFIMPKKNLHGSMLSEFFESGFGFTATKTYHQILEKYLGFEILESVEME